MYKTGMILLSCLLLISCNNQTSESNSTIGKYQNSDESIAYNEKVEMEPPRTAESPTPPEFTLEKGSKIIKNGYMEFEVNGLEMAKNSIDSILNKFNGYYENEQFNSFGNRISHSLQLRIPNTKFDSLAFRTWSWRIEI